MCGIASFSSIHNVAEHARAQEAQTVLRTIITFLEEHDGEVSKEEVVRFLKKYQNKISYDQITQGQGLL